MVPRNNVGEQRSRRIGGVQSSVMTCLTALPLLFLLLSFIFVQSTLSLDFKGGNSKTYSQCEKCKIVVDSFKEGLKRTARGKHEGGDAHWEEKKLSNYANSEIRLTEIQENLCHEVSLGKDQCHSFAEEFESALEEWFFQHLKKERVDQIDEGSSLFDHLCNDVASACCPEGHYGPSCTPCQGYPKQVCNGRGYCAGNGTREGKGNCKCFRGYGGKQCEKCAKSYFDAEATESSGDSANQIPKICQRCDRSCASSCHSSGPRGCHVCGKGYTWDQETGCIDVNECSELEVNPCTESTYCSNTVGSFKCLQCMAINDYDDCLLLDTVRRLISQALVDAPLLCSVQLYINWSRNSRDGSNNNNFRPCIVHVLSLFRLLETLNSLRGLQRLTVIVDHPVFNTIPADNANAQLDLSPVLSHLREFNFSTGDELQTTPVLGWLEKAVAEANAPLSLQSIRLGNPDLRHSLTEFTDRHPALGALILELPRVFWSNPSVFVSRSLCSLPSLTHLSLKAHCTDHLFGLLYAAGAGAGKWNNGGAAAAIAPITQNLTSLSISLNTWSPSTGHAPLAAFDHHLLFPTIFPAVRSLRLIAHVRSHRDLHSPLWAALFPSLEHIELAHNCVSCNLCPNRPGRLTTKARAQVAKLFEETLFTPFKACARLSTLNVRKDGGKWTQSYVVTQVNGWKVPLKVGQSSTTCRARGRGSHRRSSSTSSTSSNSSR